MARIYYCDICGEEVKGDTNYSRLEIMVKNYAQYKLYDLCPNCAVAAETELKAYKPPVAAHKPVAWWKRPFSLFCRGQEK